MSLLYDVVAPFIGENLLFFRAKVRDGVKFKLRVTLSDDEADELVMDVVFKLLDRLVAGKVAFTSTAKVTGYILFGAWCNYRSSKVKSKSKKKPVPLADWMEEGSQKTVVNRTGFATGRTLYLEECFATGTSASAEQHVIDHLGTTTRAATDQDLTDSYYADLYQKLFDYLDDSVADGEFRFDEASIFKQYVLNNWTMKTLVEQSDFKRSYVFAAVKKVKTHLKGVCWFIKPTE